MNSDGAAERRFPWSGALVTMVLAGLAAFLGARLGSDPAEQRYAPVSERVFELIGDEDDLTPDQRAAISEVGSRFASVRERLRLQSQALNAELLGTMAEEQRFGPHTQAKLDELQRVMGERLKLSMEYMLEVRAVLTPVQRDRFDQRLAEEAARSR